jgi:8-amino-7-oxononanoate synthase
MVAMNFSNKLSSIKKKHLYRSRKIIERSKDSIIVIGNKSFVNFCSNDYLSLSNNPLVSEAFQRGVRKYGSGSGASHLVSGHSRAHHELEEALADYTGQERSLLFSSGYTANIGIFSALKDDLDWVLQDKLNHASLIDANQLIGLPLKRYTHNKIESLEKKIAKQSGNGLIATDTVFSMDGDKSDIDSIAKIANSNDAIVMQDDAHGFGIFEPNIPINSIYMATLGKAAGVMGAFVAGSEDFIEYLIQKSRPYIYTTAISPAICMAIMKSLDLIKQGEQKEKLISNIDFFKQIAKELNLPLSDSVSAIQPLILGTSESTMKASLRLYDSGFYVSAIRPPTVPNGTARLRITLCADHTRDQIKQFLIQLKDAIQ